MNDLWSKTELKKCGLRQSKDGIIISFVLHPNDVTDALVSAPIGTVYLAALVEKVEESVVEEKAAKHHLSQRVAFLCNDIKFNTFLAQAFPEHITDPLGEFDAAEVVRGICEVDSRSEFDTDPSAASRWNRKIYGVYQQWLEN